MAIKECRECKKEVSSEARVCPHCGCKKPVFWIRDYVSGFAGLGVVAFIVFSVFGG